MLDLCSGSGALAVHAAALSGREVTAVDVSRRAVLTMRLNALLNRVRVRALRGDLFGAVAGERFDAIVSNPPYVPAPTDELPARGPARAWDAGRDGRALLDRICERAARAPAPGRRACWSSTRRCSATSRPLARSPRAGWRSTSRPASAARSAR